jgi:Protein of unknown function (DUF4238)
MASSTTGSASNNPRGNAPRDHHFIPVFYLKQWVDPASRKLIEYSTKHGKFIAKSVGPRGTGFETDLYSFPELPPNLAQYVEAEFFKFADDKAAIALQKHLRGETGGAGTSPGETITATRSWTRSAASAGSRSSWFSHPAIFDHKVPAFNVAGFVQTPPETGQPGGVGLRRPVV